MNLKAHWESVYERKKPEEVSWYQENPARSLAMIESAGLGKEDPIIDVGGGASKLASVLYDLGYRNLTVLDISKKALETARQRMGAAADAVQWVEADVTRFRAPQRYRFWHDRAVFHFLTDPADRKLYLETLRNSLSNPGYVMIASFSLEGPERCSGLPVQRYSQETLQQTLGSEFECLRRESEAHRTPGGTLQQFLYSLFRREV
ncbi:class I SAM-dependent methyltransferase [Deltaproteobacteria bacterium PRO3]|nr:class I SAM-dependent methyltransferase [Deltaproteobacteria bacterium PRO3]